MFSKQINGRDIIAMRGPQRAMRSGVGFPGSLQYKIHNIAHDRGEFLEHTMLESLLIERFRLFRHLEIPRLGRVNLIVGRNNSGKSTVLEALNIYGASANPEVLVDLLSARQEVWRGHNQANGDSVNLNPVRHLFHDHIFPKIGQDGLVLGPLNSRSEQLGIAIAAYKTERDEKQGGDVRVLVEPGERLEDLAEVDIALVAREPGKSRRLLWLDRDLEIQARRYRGAASISAKDRGYPTVTVATTNIAEDVLASLWDDVALTDLQAEAISALQLLEPGITGVTFVEAMVQRPNLPRRLPLVKLEQGERLPLRSLGDGATRLFHIAVALVSAQDGTVLIDEFENGLHWSLQPGVWKTVFRLAKNLNVQVFATTHSRDCIRGFEAAWREDQSNGAFLRLNLAKDGGVSVTSYSSETLADALETDVEIR